MDRPGSVRLVTGMIVAIAAVSCGSIFVRLAAAPSLAVAAYRVVWSAVILMPACPARELKPLTRADWGLLTVSGMALALHFGLWIASLSYTSVASSVLLVDTSPFFIGLASHWFLGRPSRRAFWIGLSTAFLGCFVVFLGDWSRSHDSMRGNLLALGGAIALCGYLLAGARARIKLSLFAYVWPVYGVSAILLVSACLVSGVALRGYSGRAHLFMFLLGLIPQCIGHTTYNWSLRWLPPTMVALIGLAEPVGASFLAWLILGESLSAMKLAGGSLILLGIYIATKDLNVSGSSDQVD